jgi:predicted dehydrogenase
MAGVMQTRNLSKQEIPLFNLTIVGLGAWGKRLINSVQGQSESVRFARAVTRTVANARDFAEHHHIALGDDYAAALGDTSIDGVVVCGPGNVHAEHALAAIDAGKHVLVIKPFALGRSEAEAVFAAADKKGVFVGLGYERCFLPAADELRRRVAAGELGRIVHAEGAYCVGRYLNMTRDDWKTDATIAPPGALADHMLYMMIELMGPVAEVHASGLHLVTDLDVPDTATVRLRFASAASGLLTAIGVSPEFARLHFFGTEGWAELRGSSRLEIKPRGGEATVIEFPAFDTLRAQIEAFAGAATGAREFPLSPRQTIDSVAAVEAMGKSALAGGPIEL